MEKSFLIKFALDYEDRLCPPEKANKFESYYCPGCRDSVILKRGNIRKPHFAHRSGNTCSYETVMHKTAKILIMDAVKKWKSDKSEYRIEIRKRCSNCSGSTGIPLPDKVDYAILEYKLADGSVADVALMSGNMAVAAVEILVTHAVDDMKADRLSVPFIEMEGKDIIEDCFIWNSIRDTFKPRQPYCDMCKSNYSKFQSQAEQIAKASGMKLPIEYYRYWFRECWKCKRKIILYTWTDKEMYSKVEPKVKPIPKTVHYRYSHSHGCEYWANICPYCNSIQGDFFLHAINIKEDSPEAFRKDLFRVSSLQCGICGYNYWYEHGFGVCESCWNEWEEELVIHQSYPQVFSMIQKLREERMRN